MKAVLKLIWYFIKKAGTLFGIQVVIALLGFVILMIPSDIAQLLIGIPVVLLNCFLFYKIGKGGALNDFKYKKNNLIKFKGNTPVYESCKEMKLNKVIGISGIFFGINAIIVLLGALLDSAILRAIANLEFLGVYLIASGSGFIETVNGIAADAEAGIEAVAGKPMLFSALFLPLILIITLSYLAGYYISMQRRNKLHKEINEEIDMIIKSKA